MSYVTTWRRPTNNRTSFLLSLSLSRSAWLPSTVATDSAAAMRETFFLTLAALETRGGLHCSRIQLELDGNHKQPMYQTPCSITSAPIPALVCMQNDDAKGTHDHRGSLPRRCAAAPPTVQRTGTAGRSARDRLERGRAQRTCVPIDAEHTGSPRRTWPPPTKSTWYFYTHARTRTPSRRHAIRGLSIASGAPCRWPDEQPPPCI